MIHSCRKKTLLAFLASVLLGVMAPASYSESPEFSPYTVEGEKKLLWGDTHLHTTLSLDARAFGVTLDQEQAYRFARGEQVTSTHGLEVKLSRPLDFLVVSDHSDAMGTMSEIIAGNPDFMKDQTVIDWNERLNTATDALKVRMEVMTALTSNIAPDYLFDRGFFNKIWQQYVATADAFNDPGRFTTIIGYEWTSADLGDNLHRNVLYRDGADKAGQALPFTTSESSLPEDLWGWMEKYEQASGGRVLALAHNGNISNGLMFPEINPATGEKFTKDYVKARARWEPLYEVTQIKGDGETHPYLSRNDEFADYETWDEANFAGTPKTEDMFQYEYARSALTRGLKLESELGTNPYQFGVVGSTDSHTALATGEEDNFFGKMSFMEPTATRWKEAVGKVGDFVVPGWQMTASGYAAVWATENTREAIFDAMMRRETYATTGPRMTVRFNGSLGAQSVPMGGELNAEKGVAPSFMIEALKDPIGANLDRIQVIKGYLMADGITHEKIYNVVWSGDREINDGKLAPVGNTVDIENASYVNSIGDVQLNVSWVDPDFDPDQSAYYYVRVLEIPTPRWTAFDQKRFGITMDEGIPQVTQERAYTSPIWYHSN